MNVLMVQSYTFFLRRPGFLPIFIFAGRIHGYRSNLFHQTTPTLPLGKEGTLRILFHDRFEKVANLQ